MAETAASLRLEDLKEIQVPETAVLGEDYTEVHFEPDLEVLEQFENAVLTSPATMPRTVARAVLVSLTDNEQFSRHEEWRSVATSLPHVADNLGRYLRGAAEQDEALWPTLGDWFREYQASVWGRLDWVSSQYGLVFPASHMPTPVMSVLHRWLESSSNLQQVAIAVQRICTITPVVGRNLIRGRVDRTADPLLLRVFALGLLLAGDNKDAVETVLLRDPRNHLLLKCLQATSWREPAVVKDFDLSAADSDHA